MSWHMWIFNPLWQEYHWIWKWQESQSLAQTRTHHQWLYNGLERTTFSLSLNQCTQHVELWETELNVPTEAELSVFAQEGPGYIVDSKTACNWREAELGQIWECRMKSAGGKWEDGMEKCAKCVLTLLVSTNAWERPSAGRKESQPLDPLTHQNLQVLTICIFKQ